MQMKMFLTSVLAASSLLCFAAPDAAKAPAPASRPVAPSSGSVTPAAAQPGAAAEEASAEAQPKTSPFKDMLPIIIMVVVMILIFSRSNKKQQQKRNEMLESLVKGTRVMLTSGVYGKIVEVKEKSFIVEIAENVRIEVVKNGIASNEDAEKAKEEAAAAKKGGK